MNIGCEYTQCYHECSHCIRKYIQFTKQLTIYVYTYPKYAFEYQIDICTHEYTHCIHEGITVLTNTIFQIPNYTF